MDDFLALELNRRKDFLEKIIRDKTATLAKEGPEGRLRCAERNYDQAVPDYAKEKLRGIEQLAKKRSHHNVENIYESYGLSRKALVDPIWIPDDEFVTKWLQTKYSKKGFREGEPEYYTKKRERVRSKTEILIADILTDLGVPYLYEMPVFLKSRGWVFPGTHLIITHETQDKPIDTRLLEAVARHYLL